MKKVSLPRSITVIQKPRVPAVTKKVSEVTLRAITLDLNKSRLLAIANEMHEPIVLLEGTAFTSNTKIQALIQKIDDYVTQKLAP